MGTNEKRKRRTKKQLIFLVLFAAALIGGLQLWGKWEEQSRLIEARFVNPEGQRGPAFSLEVAANQADRARGLMYRRELAENRGMLFVFPRMGNQTFWMKNTFIPLDIVFLNTEYEVVGVLHNLTPMSEERRGIANRSVYAIEIAGGQAARHGIESGWRVNFSPEPPRAEN